MINQQYRPHLSPLTLARGWRSTKVKLKLFPLYKYRLIQHDYVSIICHKYSWEVFIYWSIGSSAFTQPIALLFTYHLLFNSILFPVGRKCWMHTNRLGFITAQQGRTYPNNPLYACLAVSENICKIYLPTSLDQQIPTALPP